MLNVKNKSFSVTAEFASTDAEFASTDGPVSGVILAQGGTVSLYRDGVGVDAGIPVAPNYDTEHGAFTGDIHRGRLDNGPDSDADDHCLRPEDLIRVAMGRERSRIPVTLPGPGRRRPPRAGPRAGAVVR